MPRNFKPKLIDQEFDKIRKLPGDDFESRRREALKKVRREPKDPNRIIAPVDFNPHLPKLSLVPLTSHGRVQTTTQLEENIV